MEQHSQSSSEEEKVVRWQYGAVVLSLLLVFPAVILSVYISSGSIRLIYLPFSIAALLVGISSIRNRVSILRVSGKKEPTRGNVAVGFGVLLIAAALFLSLFAFVPSFSDTLFSLSYSAFNGSSQATFNNLPVYDTSESTLQLYRAVESRSFVEINSYGPVSAWGDYKAVPLAIVADMVLFAGDIGAENTSGVDSNLINANAITGKVNWQTVSGSGFLAVDSSRVYVERAKQQFGGATGIISYDVHSGEKIWETSFDWEYAIGVSNLTLANSGINARTYHRGKDAFYVLDIESGEIRTFVDKGGFIFAIESGTTYEWFGETLEASGQMNWETEIGDAAFYDRQLAAPVIFSDLIIVKNRHRSYSPITAVRKNNGDVVWQFNENVVSNVAVGGDNTYFVTEQAELVALDTHSGEHLGSLQFTPNFPEAFDFANTSIFVAADGNKVAIYFEDMQQLSIFQLSLQRN